MIKGPSALIVARNNHSWRDVIATGDGVRGRAGAAAAAGEPRESVRRTAEGDPIRRRRRHHARSADAAAGRRPIGGRGARAGRPATGEPRADGGRLRSGRVFRVFTARCKVNMPVM